MHMKKRFIFALGVIAAMVAVTSCGDEDEPSDGNTCSCQEFDSDTNQYVGSSEIDPQQFGVSSCSDLTDHFNEFTQGTYISCHKS